MSTLRGLQVCGMSAVLAASCGLASGQVWNESADGDLAGNPLTPTAVSFSMGSNVIRGGVISSADVRDYFTFSIPAGKQLSAINLLSYTDSAGGPANRGYIAIASGATSFIPDATTAGNFLGGNHLDPLPPGTDLLPGLAAATTNGAGFSTPLGPGTYTFLTQQTSALQSNYAFDFVIVPTPGAGLLLGLASLTMLRRKRR